MITHNSVSVEVTELIVGSQLQHSLYGDIQEAGMRTAFIRLPRSFMLPISTRHLPRRDLTGGRRCRMRPWKQYSAKRA